jgi:hypothetical protein
VIPSFLSGKNYSGQHPISFNIVALELQFESHDIFNQEEFGRPIPQASCLLNQQMQYQ